MRILHVVTLHTPDNAFGGPTLGAIQMSQMQSDLGHDVSILGLASGFSDLKQATITGVDSHFFRSQRVLPGLGYAGIASSGLLAWAVQRLRCYDIVHSHLSRDLVTLPVTRIAQSQQLRTVVQTHGMIDESDKALAKVLDRFATRNALERADRVLHLTNFERESIRQVANVGSEQLQQLRNGLPRQSHLRTRGATPVVVFVARFHERKRPDHFVQAAREVLDSGVHAEFVMAGPDEGALQSTLHLIESLNLNASVKYLGPLATDDVMDLMRSAWIYVLPAVDEPFGRTIVEAMSVGVPVVITESCGLARTVAESNSGIVVNANPGDLARAVIELLDPKRNLEAGQQALQTSRNNFSLDEVAADLCRIYEDVLGP